MSWYCFFKFDFYRKSKVYNVNGNEAKSMYIQITLTHLFKILSPFSVCSRLLSVMTYVLQRDSSPGLLTFFFFVFYFSI